MKAVYAVLYPFMGIDFQDDMSTQHKTRPAAAHLYAEPQQCFNPCAELHDKIAELQAEIDFLRSS